MSKTRLAVVGAVVLVIAYCGVSGYAVTASLTPREICPPSAGAPPGLGAEVLTLTSGDGTRLAAWLATSSGQRAVILVHGIDSDAWTGGAPDLARAYLAAGFDVLAFDLRAHGRSGGARMSLGRFERNDIRAAVDVLLDRGVTAGRIGLHGTSYGAAMSLLAAAGIPEVGAIVADSAYADVRDLIAREVQARARIPELIAGTLLRPGIEWAAWLLYGLDTAALAPDSVVARIAPRPLLLIHGERDRLIPVDHAERLNRRAGQATTDLWTLPGLGHTDGVRMGRCHATPSPVREEFLDRVTSFFTESLAG